MATLHKGDNDAIIIIIITIIIIIIIILIFFCCIRLCLFISIPYVDIGLTV